MMTIYLSGYIHGEKIQECMDWRKTIREHYDHWKDQERYPINWLDPLNGKNFGTITKDGLKSSIPGKALVFRDYWAVVKSDLIIINFDRFGGERPLTGTICEMAWAWEHKKPVISIMPESTPDYYKFHPFVEEPTCITVKSVEDLIDSKYINYFYKGWHSALY